MGIEAFSKPSCSTVSTRTCRCVTIPNTTFALNDHLMHKPLPQMPSVSVESTDATSMRALALKMASDASECVAPYVDAFLSLYHQAFAWLAHTAEKTEIQFLGQLSLGSATEILLPDEFTTQRLGMRQKSPDEIAAWKPSPAGAS